MTNDEQHVLDESQPPAGRQPGTDTAAGEPAESGPSSSSQRAPADGYAASAAEPDQPGGQPSDQPGRPAGGREPAERGDQAKKGSFIRELPVLIVIALAIALVIKTFVVQMFFIPSGSMQNTLAINDRIMVNKLVYHVRPIEPGDIVVFSGDGSWLPQPPSAAPNPDPVVRLWDGSVVRLYHSFIGMFNSATTDDIFVKRVIGVPGDHVVCCNARGEITVNGVALNEQSYLYPGNTAGSAPSPSLGHFDLTVPPGRLWVLGDHRAISDDSRLHSQDPDDGTIPESAVVGRAFVIVWPPGHWRILPIPATFDQPGVDHGKAAALAASAPPYLPLAGGLGAALPLTAVQRRLRRRLLLRRRGRRRRGMTADRDGTG